MKDNIIQVLEEKPLFKFHIEFDRKKECPKCQNKWYGIREQEGDGKDRKSEGDLIVEAKVPIVKLNDPMH